MKTNLIELAKEMINQTAGFNSVSIENRKEILTYIGVFGSDIDQLINKFYEINCIVDNGGAPVLKQIINNLEDYEISFVESTACLMLKKRNEYVDSVFINKFRYENGLMSNEEIQKNWKI